MHEFVAFGLLLVQDNPYVETWTMLLANKWVHDIRRDIVEQYLYLQLQNYVEDMRHFMKVANQAVVVQ